MGNKCVIRIGRTTAMVLFFLIAVSVPASADIVFTDFGSGYSYNCCVGATVTGPTSSPGFFVESAAAFTPSAEFTLTQIDVAIGYVSGTNSVMLTLNSETAGKPDGVIESWSLTGLPTFGTTSNAIETVTPVLPVTLTSGREYWLVASPIASDTWDAWNDNNIGSTGPTAQNFGSGFNVAIGTPGAFDIVGTVTKAVMNGLTRTARTRHGSLDEPQRCVGGRLD